MLPRMNTEFSPTDPDSSSPDLLAPHHPFHHKSAPVETHIQSVVVPDIATLMPSLPPSTTFGEESLEILEWLSLVSIDSPRVREGDDIDPFLCRYNVPEIEGIHGRTHVMDLVRITWKGLLTAQWVRNLWLEVVYVIYVL